MSFSPHVQYRRIPVTMLSGFLGSGKTTLLKYILENSTSKIACLVNDLASVNIDAKLVRNSTSRSDAPSAAKTALADMVELQNGCACCSAAEELFPAFAELIEHGDRSGEPYERVILENSGVAEPQNIRDSFNDAIAMGFAVTRRIELEGLITVVDSATFIKDYSSKAPMSMRPDLGDGGANHRPVVDLLVEQIECADVIVLNKADTINAETMAQLKSIMTSLNTLAHVVPASFGKIPMELIRRSGIASKMNIEAQHRSSVIAAQQKAQQKVDDDHNHDKNGAGNSHEKHHDHDHDHEKHHEHEKQGHGHEHHDHDHDHEKHHEHEKQGHDHEHHDHGHEKHHDHEKQGHGHQDHDHDHGHGHDHGHHDHDHSHDKTMATPEEKFGISSFVYLRRKPFHPIRLRQLVLRWLPAAQNSALEGMEPGMGDNPIKRVVRSKGFTWLANGHISAFYWSHAGQHFELREEGDWWVNVHPDHFPPNPLQRQMIYSDFDEEGPFGDRRQEIVFIGAQMNEELITKQLDDALLTDVEMGQYMHNWSNAPDPPHPDALYFKAMAKKAAEEAAAQAAERQANFHAALHH